MRLIDADALLKAIIGYPYGYRGMIESEIENQKTVDAVPVIRCKDCKYYQHKSLTDDEWNWCMQWHNYTDENVYCSRAEREEE